MSLQEQRRLSPSLARIISLCFYAGNALLLLAYHVQAEDAGRDAPAAILSFVQRMRQGPSAFSTTDKILLGALVALAFEFLDFCAKRSGTWLGAKHIPVRGKHLDVLSPIDILCIGFSKANTAPFTYFYFRFVFESESIEWFTPTLTNTLVALSLLFLQFDLVYTLLHWALHIPGIYGLIHKHHHKQKAPSRAAVDAINVHPVEYLLGEYNHLFALFVCTRVISVHALTAVMFLLIGGALAAINHTRHDMVIQTMGIVIYDSKVHDVHHRIPRSNYGQYTMFWDRVFGTFRPYNPSDRVNPEAQLDGRTGKTLQASKLQ